MSALKQTLDIIESRDPLHYKKINSDLAGIDESFYPEANAFIDRYIKYLHNNNKTLEYGVECYLKMIADFRSETIQFFRTGEYSSKSFKEVNERVYNNPDIMEYFMNGLLLSQFLWGHHYAVLTYFRQNLVKYNDKIKHYLEIGGGHGLYISEAIRLLNKNAKFDLVDISPTSIAISRELIANDSVDYRLMDIFDMGADESGKYDFITMGEVLEHVEDPVALLKKTAELLTDRGVMFITTPTNAPSIDHIYLFKNAAEIQQVINAAGFDIIDELSVYAEKGSLERMQKYKVTMMYGAFIQKRQP